ncbi:MAG: DNA polymerase I [Gemmatimonadaceae bacterium]
MDGYALIYRAFFALIARPLTTSRGENTSAVFGIATFLQRLLQDHKPEYVGWVHDSGLSFRHERYPGYKATRQKLTEELQSDFDRGMERICQLLAAYNMPILTLDGYEADDLIGTLAVQGVAAGVSVVVVSGDKDFQQLVRPGVWLLNPGRGGSAAVEEQWVGVENGSERLGVPPHHVTDYLALVGDSSDNIPGVPGIGPKTARDLVSAYGTVEEILKHAADIQQKRPREALLQYTGDALLSKELVTIRDDLPFSLNLDHLALQDPDRGKLKNLFLELEFHTLAREQSSREQSVAAPEAAPEIPAHHYTVVDTVDGVRKMVDLARQAGRSGIAIHTETVLEDGVASLGVLETDPLRSVLVSIAVSIAPDEAYYLPLRHRTRRPAQGALLLGDANSPGDVQSATTRKTRKKSAGGSGSEGVATAVEQTVRNLPALDAAEMEPLRALLEDPAVPKTAHDWKFSLLALRRAGITLRGLDCDTKIASYVLDPGRRSHDLEQLALEFLGSALPAREQICGKGRGALRFDECTPAAASTYACGAADATLRLRARFEPQLKEQGVEDLFRNIELPLTGVLADMEVSGISIDRAWFSSLKERFQRDRQTIEQSIYKEAGEEFNINSNPQLRHILFEKLPVPMPILKRTATGPSTDAGVLQELAEMGHTLPSLLMEYRELAKLENTYLDALPALVNPETGRLHTSFNQTVATTGRLSSSDPNLQNIPIRRELGRAIRRGFVARSGWLLLSADYSQIELRVLAHLSGDPLFTEAFHAGGDIHRQTASIIFGMPVSDVTPEMRARAKTINFATIYGQGPHALSRQLRIDHAEAKRFIAEYFERFKGIRTYLDSMVALAYEKGYVETIFGRRRYIRELRDQYGKPDRNFNIRAFGERTATNSPIQGSAADLIKVAMIRVHRSLTSAGLEARMLLQVHDELVFEASREEEDAVRAMVKQAMEGAAQLSVPLVVDIGTGDNWLETKG